MMIMAKLERIYTIPLRDAFLTSRSNRVPRAIKIVRAFVTRHMKAEDVIISEELNKHIWARSIQKPPRRVKVRLIKDDVTVRAYLADEKIVEKKAKGEEKKSEAKKEEKKEAAPEKKSEPKVEHKPPSPAAEAKKEKK
jgi:large subunit ribosomal protein L31e